jgi:hypothetical protein
MVPIAFRRNGAHYLQLAPAEGVAREVHLLPYASWLGLL